MWQTVEPMTNDKEKNCKKTVDEDAAGRDVEQKERSYLKPTTRRPQTNVKVIKTYMKNALYSSHAKVQPPAGQREYLHFSVRSLRP